MSQTVRFEGTIVDLVTPFRDGELDRTGLPLLIEWQIQSGVEGLLVCGEAGEAHCLSDDERVAVIAAAVDGARGRVPVLVGILANGTDKAVHLVEEARRMRADGVVIGMPYYNKPCLEGVFQHLSTVTEAAAMPVLLLSRPGVTMMPFHRELAERLAVLPRVAGLCTRDPAIFLDLSSGGNIGRPLYSGDDQAEMTGLLGAAGTLSWVANVAPRLAASLHHAAAGGNLKAAHAVQTRLQPLLDAMDRDHPVSTLKQALAYVFGTSPEVRLPLVPMDEQNLPALRTALSLVGMSTSMPFLSAVAAATQGGPRCRL